MTVQTRPVKIATKPEVKLDADEQITARAGDDLAPAVVTTDAVLAQVRRRIAPLWPLHSFVAVNPFLGHADQDFATAAQTLARHAGAKMTAPRSFYAAAIHKGRITQEDLAAALAAAPSTPGAPDTVAALIAFATTTNSDAVFARTPTVADAARRVTKHDWGRLATESISQWAASYFDEGQAYWTSPWRHLPAYAAWRAEAVLDRTPEVAGIRGFRRTVQTLPDTASATIDYARRRLGIPAAGLEPYLHRLLMTIGGWAGYARYLLWQAELNGATDSTLDDLLAVRLAWEVALYDAFADEGLDEVWTAYRRELIAPPFNAAAEAVLAGDLLLQSALERAFQRELAAKLALTTPPASTMRARAQAAFCIDVRSEVFRRALESTAGDVETIGFAGFFGFPIEYVPLGAQEGHSHCPVLLKPQFVVTETVLDTDSAATATATLRAQRRAVAKAWRKFKFGAVACFAFVGPVGLAYVKKLITDSLGKSRPVESPATFGLDRDVSAHLGPTLEPSELDGRITGMSLVQQLDVATGVLKGMSLTDSFARLVLLVGHGATTVNNPHAAGLDCGACGGHTGEANVRVAAQVLNKPEVRAGLQQRGISIPADTLFVACQHDTTTDQVTIFDKPRVPATHLQDIAEIEVHLADAGKLARAERAQRLNINAGSDIDAAIMARSKDWSQVRPEWGLAGCAAFIVAPRTRTYGLDLNGRTFLHSYDWQQDTDFSVLDLIMTAPMIVTSWINLQYYASTVDNRVFGSGNKALHNVVGTLGVLEGNGGDLRTGLPWQSVSDGAALMHEPLRLHVVIEAPIDAINAIIARHDSVRQLVDNQWIYLLAMDRSGHVTQRYTGDLTWEPVSTERPAFPYGSDHPRQHWLN